MKKELGEVPKMIMADGATDIMIAYKKVTCFVSLISDIFPVVIVIYGTP